MARTTNIYMQIVFNFVQQQGPFKLDMISHTKSDDVNCQCCGKRAIHRLYHVSNQKGVEFIIGSECQQWALELTDAHLPASRVRELDARQLAVLAEKYGVTLVPATGDVGLALMAQQVIDARRKFANTQGWRTRVQGKGA